MMLWQIIITHLQGPLSISTATLFGMVSIKYVAVMAPNCCRAPTKAIGALIIHHHHRAKTQQKTSNLYIVIVHHCCCCCCWRMTWQGPVYRYSNSSFCFGPGKMPSSQQRHPSTAAVDHDGCSNWMRWRLKTTTTTTTIALTWMNIKRNGAITTRDQSMDLNSAKMIIQFGHPVDSKYSLLLLLSSLLLCNAVVVAAVMLSQSAVQLRMWTKDPYSNLIGAQRHHRARINPLYWGNWWRWWLSSKSQYTALSAKDIVHWSTECETIF